MPCPDNGGGLARAGARAVEASEHGPDRVKSATELLLEWRIRDLEERAELQVAAVRASDARHEREVERLRLETLAVVMERDALVEQLRVALRGGGS